MGDSSVVVAEEVVVVKGEAVVEVEEGVEEAAALF